MNKFAPDDGDSMDALGRAVAVESQIARIGTSWDEDPTGDIAGAAYVYPLSVDQFLYEEEWDDRENRRSGNDGGNR